VVKHSSYPIVADAWQLTDVTRFGLTEAQVAERVYFVIDGQNYGGHLAFAYILFVQKNWLLKAAGWLMTVPPVCWVASIGYRLVARFRHRLPGGTPACKLPPAV
jgi:predicted DCC family thiol-disulfide oxidoreductase YuxK